MNDIAPRISVIMPVYNDEAYLRDAIEALLAQSMKDFELIFVDDASTDDAPRIIHSFKDERIRYVRNKKNVGASNSRNVGIKLAKGEYVFFADSDCINDTDWLLQGYLTFKKKMCLGVEGTTYYGSKNYFWTIRDRRPGTVGLKNQYMGCNIAYRRDILLKLQGFDTRFAYNDDREFAYRLLRIGKIAHCERMIVTHQIKHWTVKSYIMSGKRAQDRILLFKYHNEKNFMWGRVLYPKNLLKLVLPPLVLGGLFDPRCKSWGDAKLVLASYFRLMYERFCIWRAAIKNRMFAI